MKNKTCCCCTTKLDKGVEFNNKTYCVECYNNTLVDLKLDRGRCYGKCRGLLHEIGVGLNKTKSCRVCGCVLY